MESLCNLTGPSLYSWIVYSNQWGLQSEATQQETAWYSGTLTIEGSGTGISLAGFSSDDLLSFPN